MMKNLDWLSIEEAMEYLKIKSKTTLYKIKKKHKITVCKIESLTYFKRQDFDNLFDANSTTQ